jgi:hypothetical protein
VFEAASDSKLMLRSAHGRRIASDVVPREGILQVAVEHKRRNSTGAIIGGAGGFLWGLALSGLNCSNGGCAFGVAVLNGILGALAGHALSPVHARREVIYQARAADRCS